MEPYQCLACWFLAHYEMRLQWIVISNCNGSGKDLVEELGFMEGMRMGQGWGKASYTRSWLPRQSGNVSMLP